MHVTEDLFAWQVVEVSKRNSSETLGIYHVSKEGDRTRMLLLKPSAVSSWKEFMPKQNRDLLSHSSFRSIFLKHNLKGESQDLGYAIFIFKMTNLHLYVLLQLKGSHALDDTECLQTHLGCRWSNAECCQVLWWTAFNKGEDYLNSCLCISYLGYLWGKVLAVEAWGWCQGAEPGLCIHKIELHQLWRFYLCTFHDSRLVIIMKYWIIC